MRSPSQLALYARTVANLRPAQAVHRVRLRAQRAVIPHIPEATWRRLGGQDHRGWPAGYAPLDRATASGYPSAEENASGTFRFLEDERALGSPPDWRQAEASQLWRYHLHYFDWALSFAAHPDQEWARDEFASLYLSWRAGSRIGVGDAWSPYVVSLRAWSMCAVFDDLVQSSPVEGEVVDDLRRHARFLRAHLEYDVGGNHLVKNLKGIVGLGVFLADDRLIDVGRRALALQVSVQVLADGGHYERSPLYHCQVLGDFADVGDLLEAAGRPPVPGLGPAIDSMRTWLGAMLLPDGDVPLFNDCAMVGPDRVRALQPVAPEQDVTVLQPSGYVVVRKGRLHLVADAGPPCPPDLPAHAQADCLSFELAVDGQRIVVDTGTSTYAPGPRRAFERSTAAHNTVQLDGADQTEVWGVFRAARLARPRLERISREEGVVEMTASHDGYRRLPGRPVHRRTWRLTEDGLEIEDTVTGTGHHRLVARFHVAPGLPVVARDDGSWRAGPLAGSVAGAEATVERAEIATGFGRLATGSVLVLTAEGLLPMTVRTTWTAAAKAPSTILPVETRDRV